MCILISIFLCFALVPKLVPRTVDFHWYWYRILKFWYRDNPKWTFNKMTLLCEAALKTKRFIHPGACSSLPAPPRSVFLYFYTSAPSYESPLLEIIDTEHLSRRHLLIIQLQHNLLVCYTTELLSHHSVCDTNCQQQEVQTIASIQFGLIQRQENTHTHKFFSKKSVYSVYEEAIEYQVLFSLAV